jgi:YidC/Oxa1 family membrane protein insertase
MPADPADFHFNLELEIRNLGDAPATVNFELWGPTGLPTEGWWYQQKIHGNTWSFGKMAGARDVTVSTVGRPFQFFSSPDIVTSRQKNNEPIAIIGDDLTVEEREIRHLAVDTQYFTVALLPEGKPFECYSAFATNASKIDSQDKLRGRKLTDVNFVVFSNSIEIPPYDAAEKTGSWTTDFRIFAGPKDPAILARNGLENARTFGWFGMFSKPLIGLLHLLYKATFSLSYGLAIVLLTVIVRSLMIPISRKAALNAQMMQHLSPQIKELAEKYKEQPEKRVQAQQELFAKYRYNPFGGCLLMLLQMPIFLGLYRGLSVDVALRDAPLVPGMTWCSNLAGPDQFYYWADWMPAWFGAETGWLGPWLNILPIVAIGLMLAQQKLFMPPATDDQSRMAQSMMKYMMVFMAFVFFKVASGLCIYFITSSIWGIIERKMLPKPELDIGKIEARASGKSTQGKVFGKRKPQESADFGLTNQKALEQRKLRDRDRQRKLRDR